MAICYNVSKIVCGCIKQRYFLSVMLMLGFMLNILNRINFVVVLREINNCNRMEVNNPACPIRKMEKDEINCTVDVHEFVWGSNLQNLILLGYPFGTFIGWLPAGLGTDWFGAKTLFGFSVFIPGVLALLTPLSMRTSPYAIMTCRVITGIFSAAQIPTTAYFAARWFPLRRQGIMLASVIIGLPMAFIFRFFVVEHLLSSVKQWAKMQYFGGILCIIWAYIWQEHIWDDPFENPYITRDELKMLAQKVPFYAKNWTLSSGSTWPWKAILSSTSVWALALGTTGYLWAFYFVIAIIPTMCFTDIHRTDFTEHPNITSFIFLLMIITVLTAGLLLDTLRKKRICVTTHIIHTYYAVSVCLSSAATIGVTHSGCFMTTIFMYYMCALVTLGIGLTTHIHACLSMAPNLCGIVFAISGLLSVMALPLQGRITLYFTANKTLNEWKVVSYIYSTINILSTAVFLKWGQCNLQTWNEPNQITEKPTKQGVNGRKTKSKLNLFEVIVNTTLHPLNQSSAFFEKFKSDENQASKKDSFQL